MIPVGTICLIVGMHMKVGEICTVIGPEQDCDVRYDGRLFPMQCYPIELASGERCDTGWAARGMDLRPIAPPKAPTGRYCEVAA